MGILRQISAISLMNIRSLPRRVGASSIIVVGMAGVVGVLVSVLAMASGLTHAVGTTGRPDRAIVLQGGADTETGSSLSRGDLIPIFNAPGIAKDNNGKVIASPEVVEIVAITEHGGHDKADVTLRGVNDQLTNINPEVKIVEGRIFQSGVRELIIGRSSAARFPDIKIGSHVPLPGGDWTVVGLFEAGGNSHESEFLGDVETVLSSFRRTTFHSAVVRLTSADALNGFRDALTSNPALSVDVERESDFYGRQSDKVSKNLYIIAYLVGGIMALGALFGALNTMYSSVSTRSREIGTLLALGFSPYAVLVSILVETMVLALMGGVIGTTLSWALFHGNAISTLAGGYSQVVFHLAITLPLIVAGNLWACAIGGLGGLFPALRAARLPLATVLRPT